MFGTNSFEKAILTAMQDETRRIVDEEAQNAAERVEERVREQAGRIATKVSSMVNFERMANEIIIKVNIPKDYGKENS